MTDPAALLRMHRSIVAARRAYESALRLADDPAALHRRWRAVLAEIEAAPLAEKPAIADRARAEFSAMRAAAEAEVAEFRSVSRAA